ncbi:MAG: hypothetical protein HOK30_00800 [Rhodospirillaceae bacterium]|nr:hypothetical protein [Rhodospirillaceae bacterium]MBT6426173.1 hypothetical protein [Rhodospirillaceae bacterium]
MTALRFAPIIFLFVWLFNVSATAMEAFAQPRPAVHTSVPYLDRAVSPAVAAVMRAVRKHEPRMVQEDLGQEVVYDDRYSRATAQAVARYQRAADDGFVMAHYNLARSLADGRGVPRDLVRALESFRLAASKGNIPAMLRLAEFHLVGLGTPRSRVEAQAYYFVAASMQNLAAARAQSLLVPHMSNLELEQVRKRARILRDAMPKIDLVLQRVQETELLTAAAEGDLEKVDTLLKLGVDANAINKLGRTSIITAVWRGQIEIVRSLLDAGVDIDAVDKEGRTALTWASINGYPEIVDVLLAESALVDVRDNKGLTPLIRAAWNGHEEIVQSLVNAGADVYAADENGMTALERAESASEIQIAAVLRAGPKITARETVVLLADDDGKVGAMALLNRKRDGKEVILNKINQMLQVDPTGKIETGTASKEFLEQEFGTVLETLPPRVIRKRRVAQDSDIVSVIYALLLRAWPFILIILVVVVVIMLIVRIRRRRS